MNSPVAPNVKAIKEWVKENRPDVDQNALDGLMANEGVFFAMAMAFEAGRTFQRKNPDTGEFLDPFKEYK